MTIDQAGKDFIQSFEGYRQMPYQDSVGVWTVGIGHKILPGQDYPDGLTEAQADDLLMSDLAPVEATINLLAPNCNQNQYNALCSFGFNLGIGALQMMLNHGFSQVSVQMPRWDDAGGKVVAGLLRRRQAETALFEQGEKNNANGTLS